MTDRHDAARDAILALLNARAAGATVCPSEVARVLARDGRDWRAAMPVVHAAVDAMVAGGVVRLSWKGAAMAVRAGPYRIGLGEIARESRLTNGACGPSALPHLGRVLR